MLVRFLHVAWEIQLNCCALNKINIDMARPKLRIRQKIGKFIDIKMSS